MMFSKNPNFNSVDTLASGGMEHRQLGIVDLIVFAVSLCMSLGVGLFYMWREKKMSQKRASGTRASTKSMDFLVGGQKLPMFPVMLSVLTTFLSGISLLGTPAEVYQRGALFFVWYWTAPLALLFTAYFFVPMFYQFRPISIYEYFQLRFGSPFLRKVAAFIFLLTSLFYMAVVIYAPAVALSGVTNLQTTPLILAVAFVCTFYTSIGGLRAVIWTDSLQAVFMYGGLITVIAMGVTSAGGLSEVWRIASESGRFTPLTYIDPDPAQYCSLWEVIFGGFIFWMSLYGPNQMAMQRYCNLPTLQSAYKVIGLTIPFFLILGSLCCCIGLVMLAYFYKCDPLGNGDVQTKDQLVILMVVDTLGQIPGLAGVFVACLFSGTLSTVSSGISSMTAVTWEDFLKGRFGGLSDNSITLLSKSVSVCYGLLSMCLAFSASSLGGLVSAALTVMGGLSGPLMGLFFLGVFMPRANKYGCLFGGAVAMALCIWMALGNWWHKVYRTFSLPYNNSACDTLNTSFVALSYDTESPYGDTSIFYLYRLSTFMYCFYGLALTIIIGGVASLAVPKRFLMDKNGKIPTMELDLKLTYYWGCEPRPEPDFV